MHARQAFPDRSRSHHPDQFGLFEINAKGLSEGSGQERVAGLALKICDEDGFFPVQDACGHEGAHGADSQGAHGHERGHEQCQDDDGATPGQQGVLPGEHPPEAAGEVVR